MFRFEDGKDVRYDLSTGQTIGKLGKPVKDICTQLRGYGILEVIKSFQDENYRNFLKFVDSQVNKSTSLTRQRWGRVEKLRNVGSFLSKIQNYSRYEQFFACGLKKVATDIQCNISAVPKGLIKLCRQYDILLNQDIIEAYVESPDLFNNLLNMSFTTLSKENVLTLLLEKQYRFRSIPAFRNLIENYNYKPQSLLIYIDNLCTYEALDNYHFTLNELRDYVDMMSKISPKYEKYPKNFLTTHKIACRNYNRLKEQFEEEDFKKRISKDLEYSWGNYKFIYPKSTQDIKDEAVQQNNCVASYIKRVIDGQCHILFMRSKEETGKSLVTLEVREGRVVQAKGKFNRDISSAEQIAIDHYNKRLERMKIAC